MKNAWRFALVSLAGLALVGGALTLPQAKAHQARQQEQAAQQTQSVSGKIASVDKTSFTLTVGSAMEEALVQDPSSARTMSFSIDKNTTVEGTLKVGSSADVTYRTDNGANIAISVHVTP
jgi:Cu/Ag efflux protein CusF